MKKFIFDRLFELILIMLLVIFGVAAYNKGYTLGKYIGEDLNQTVEENRNEQY